MAELTRAYPAVFGKPPIKGDEEDTEAAEPAQKQEESFETYYSWLIMLDLLGNNDIMKWDILLELPVKEFLFKLNYRIEKHRNGNS